MSGIETVEEALGIIERRGWQHGGLGHKEGAVCIIGALSEAEFGDPTHVSGSVGYEALDEALDPEVQEALVKSAQEEGADVTKVSQLYHFNDISSSNGERVKSVLRNAIARIKPARIGAWIRA